MKMIPKASDFCDAQASTIFRLRLGVLRGWVEGRLDEDRIHRPVLNLCVEQTCTTN